MPATRVRPIHLASRSAAGRTRRVRAARITRHRFVDRPGGAGSRRIARRRVRTISRDEKHGTHQDKRGNKNTSPHGRVIASPIAAVEVVIVSIWVRHLLLLGSLPLKTSAGESGSSDALSDAKAAQPVLLQPRLADATLALPALDRS